MLRSEFAAMVMERVACEFNKLQYNVNLTDHPLIEGNKPVSPSDQPQASLTMLSHCGVWAGVVYGWLCVCVCLTRCVLSDVELLQQSTELLARH